MLYEATLLTKRKVKCRLTTTEDEQLAMKTLGMNEKMQAMVSSKQILQELIKFMIVEVDDKPVSYQELTPLDNLFGIKEIRQLELFYENLHALSEQDEESFLLSIKPVSSEK